MNVILMKNIFILRKTVEAIRISQTQVVCNSPAAQNEEEIVSLKLVLKDENRTVIEGSNVVQFSYKERSMRLEAIYPNSGDENTNTTVVVRAKHFENITNLDCKADEQISKAQVCDFFCCNF